MTELLTITTNPSSSMGDNIYVDYWRSILPDIISLLKEGSKIVQIPVPGLSRFGDRKSYYANFRISKGNLEIPKNAYAQGRDLHSVLIESDYFKDNLSEATMQFTISNNLHLKIELLASDAPDFFTEEDFEQLSKFANVQMDSKNDEHTQTYNYLKTTYNKVEYWARQVQQKLFSGGSVSLRKRPTNQANNFEEYQWAKLYPDKDAQDFKKLAFTLGIDTDDEFQIKIDTIGLGDDDPLRQKYFGVRGDYHNSNIVKLVPSEQVLDKGWQYLIDLTVRLLLELKPSYDSLLQLLKGNSMVPSQANPTPIALNLNTIFYGPPGTGKTYELQSLCNKFTTASTIQTREEFLEEIIGSLTWWETIAAALLDLKKASVPELEKHEFVRIKVRQSTTTNVKQVIWGSLQSRTDPSCEFVKFAERREPYIFLKDQNSIWSIIENTVQNAAPDIVNFLSRVRNFVPASGSTHKNYKMVTFHQSFSYEDFVEGIKPVFNKYSEEKLDYEIQKGVFHQACTEAVKLAGYDSLVDCLKDTRDGRKNKFAAAQPYGLFIDEVNRANVSAVLGELITLIEEDKRLGRENEITDLTLPYSKSAFGVPANLYIIGTMNTADRSVEALDTALRRRFSFVEMMPLPQLLHPKNSLCRFWNKDEYINLDYNEWIKEPYKSKADNFYSLIGLSRELELEILESENEAERLNWIEEDFDFLSDESFTGIRLDILLKAINERLQSLLSRDHTIGHAFLIKVYSINDLRSAFKNKILPLLQEFFYNDYAKIGLVLGNKFINTKVVEPTHFARFTEGTDLIMEFSDKKIHTCIIPTSLDDYISIYK